MAESMLTPLDHRSRELTPYNSVAANLAWLAQPLSTAWHYRELIAAVLRRELVSRFSGSAVGWLWAIAGPIITLAIYTVTFTRAVRLPVASAQGTASDYTLQIFVGLMVFGLVTEVCCRAPLLLHEHSWLLKSSIFPCEVFAWIAVFRALTFAGVSLLVLLAFQLALTGAPLISLLLLPFIVIPFTLYLLGVVWFLAALGAFTRDLSYLMASFVPLMMVATPVFYRIDDLPQSLRLIVYLNPLSIVIEMARALILGTETFSLLAWAAFCAVSLLVFRAGHAVFAHYRGIALDAI